MVEVETYYLMALRYGKLRFKITHSHVIKRIVGGGRSSKIINLLITHSEESLVTNKN